MSKVKLKELVSIINEREDNPASSQYDRFVGLEHYDSGSVNFEVISGLAKWLGLGELKRNVIVTRSYKYVLSEGQKGE